MNLWNEDTSLIRTVLLGPKVSGIDRFDCIQYTYIHYTTANTH